MVSNISTISLCQPVRADTCSGGSPLAATPRLHLQPGGRPIKHGIKMFPPKSEIRKEELILLKHRFLGKAALIITFSLHCTLGFDPSIWAGKPILLYGPKMDPKIFSNATI